MEFENASQRCSWVQVYDEGVKGLLVEDSVVWANRSDGTGTTGAPASSTAWPALVSKMLDSGCGQECLLYTQRCVPLVEVGHQNKTKTCCQKKTIFPPDQKIYKSRPLKQVRYVTWTYSHIGIMSRSKRLLNSKQILSVRPEYHFKRLFLTDIVLVFLRDKFS